MTTATRRPKASSNGSTTGISIPRTSQEVLDLLSESGCEFLLLQFTDITGHNKNVEVPKSQFDKAVDGQIMFDGSSIQGFVRIEESDMILVPDFESFRVLPWEESRHGRVGRMICDVHFPDGTRFPGCPRGTLKRQVERAAALGYTMVVGPEAEFFLFERNQQGDATTQTHDGAGYFDLAPLDMGEECRRDIVKALIALGFEVEAAHHEVAPGQHEIDFKYGDAITTADNLATFRFVVRKIARDNGLHATFMPKPIFGINGSGMHCHQSLFKGDEPAFYDEKGDHDGISETMLQYMAGVLKHARALCAVTNPIVNSYKRLVPGYEAPTHIAWSSKNRSPLVRVPARRGVGTRMELRMPDPSCNPYLAFATMLAAGLDGIENGLEPPAPVNKNIYTMSARERGRFKIGQLPKNLEDAIDALEKDSVVKAALGEHISTNFIEAKRSEWSAYIAQVHAWEVDQYLSSF